MERMLRPLRMEWDMEFAQSGQEALDRLARGPFDVVVSDMRMPGMDGVQLLNEVMERYPQTIRVVLSGQADERSAIRCIDKTHLVIAKPCDPDTLRNTVSRACRLQDQLHSADLKRVVAGIHALPSLPSVYLELSHELRAPDPSIRRVAEIVSKDVAMVAKMLQLVNSAYFGLYSRITTAEQAAIMLGMRTIQALALSTHIFSQFEQSRVRAFGIDALMSHCVATGTLARSITRAERRAQDVADNALTSGLLHDVGKLVLAANMPDEYAKAIEVSKADGISLSQAEHDVLGTGHAEIGGYLLTLWGLPEEIVEATTFHHAPMRALDEGCAALTFVHAADALEHSRGPEDETPSGMDEEYMRELGMSDRVGLWRELVTDQR